MLDVFDPLRQLPPQQKPSSQERSESIAVTNKTSTTYQVTSASPNTKRSSSNPFRLSRDIGNPFQEQATLSVNNTHPDIRHCISETNLSRLKLESSSRSSEMHVSRSQDNLMDLGSEVRHCVLPEEIEEDPLDYKNRRVVRSNDGSPTMERRNGRQGSKYHLDFNAPSASKAATSQVSMDQPEITRSMRKKRFVCLSSMFTVVLNSSV